MTRVLVTGGAKGVGAEIVRALVADGHDVDFTYRSSGEQAQALAAEIAQAAPGRSVRTLPLDLSDKTALDAFCEQCEGEAWFGLVHNAGQPYDTLAAMLMQDKAEAAMQVNFWAFTRLAKSLMRGMIHGCGCARRAVIHLAVIHGLLRAEHGDRAGDGDQAERKGLGDFHYGGTPLERCPDHGARRHVVQAAR